MFDLVQGRQESVRPRFVAPALLLEATKLCQEIELSCNLVDQGDDSLWPSLVAARLHVVEGVVVGVDQLELVRHHLHHTAFNHRTPQEQTHACQSTG